MSGIDALTSHFTRRFLHVKHPVVLFGFPSWLMLTYGVGFRFKRSGRGSFLTLRDPLDFA